MSGSAVRLVIVGDQPPVRERISHLLEFVLDVDVVGRAADAREALRLVAECDPDVALVDEQLPATSQLTERLRAQRAGLRVVILIADSDLPRLQGALTTGADAVVGKVTSPDQLGQVIRAVARGETFTAVSIDEPRTDGSPLTNREVEVLARMAQGATNRGIAEELFIAEGTAKRHVENIREKLGAQDRASAVAEGFRRGLVS